MDFFFTGETNIRDVTKFGIQVPLQEKYDYRGESKIRVDGWNQNKAWFKFGIEILLIKNFAFKCVIVQPSKIIIREL